MMQSQDHVSPLEHQYAMLNELVRVADDIIQQQTEIKQKTERMKLKNEELQTKSRELQEVLKSSQQQLLSDTSIPIELINQLAAVVRKMKESHHTEFQELVTLFNNVQIQFEKQQKVFESSVTESVTERADRPTEILISNKESPQNQTENHEASKVGGAWKQTPGDACPAVTILQVKDEVQGSSSQDSPASHSELVTTELLASLTRNADKGRIGGGRS